MWRCRRRWWRAGSNGGSLGVVAEGLESLLLVMRAGALDPGTGGSFEGSLRELKCCWWVLKSDLAKRRDWRRGRSLATELLRRLVATAVVFDATW